MKKTFEEWVEIYEKKSGDKHICPEGYVTLYEPVKGYAQYKVNPEKSRLFIYETCGDGRYWYDKGVEICRDNGIPYLVTICTRRIMPYLRLMGGKIKVKTIQPERHNGYKIEGVNHLGKRFFCWPAWWDEEKQCNAYYVVSEVTK